MVNSVTHIKHKRLGAQGYSGSPRSWKSQGSGAFLEGEKWGFRGNWGNLREMGSYWKIEEVSGKLLRVTQFGKCQNLRKIFFPGGGGGLALFSESM